MLPEDESLLSVDKYLMPFNQAIPANQAVPVDDAMQAEQVEQPLLPMKRRARNPITLEAMSKRSKLKNAAIVLKQQEEEEPGNKAVVRNKKRLNLRKLSLKKKGKNQPREV